VVDIKIQNAQILHIYKYRIENETETKLCKDHANKALSDG